MSPAMKVMPPKNDSEYFERLSKALFTAGLSWKMVENKWPEFRRAFSGFSPERVAKVSEAGMRTLMKDPGIVRNERKIRATVENAKTVLELKKKHGSLKAYIESFDIIELGSLGAQLFCAAVMAAIGHEVHAAGIMRSLLGDAGPGADGVIVGGLLLAATLLAANVVLDVKVLGRTSAG